MEEDGVAEVHPEVMVARAWQVEALEWFRQDSAIGYTCQKYGWADVCRGLLDVHRKFPPARDVDDRPNSILYEPTAKGRFSPLFLEVHPAHPPLQWCSTSLPLVRRIDRCFVGTSSLVPTFPLQIGRASVHAAGSDWRWSL